MKILKNTCIGIAIVLVVIIYGLFLLDPLVLLFLLPNPPEPNIKSAEFSFELIYEINGEKKTIKDKIVCYYDGIEVNAGQGKVNIWSSRIKSGGERIVLWKDEERNKELCYNEPPAECLLGNKKRGEGYARCILYTKRKDGYWYERHITRKNLKKKYGIKILSWKCDPPIENTFKRGIFNWGTNGY